MQESECMILRYLDATAVTMAVPGAMAGDLPRPPQPHASPALSVTPPQHEDYLRDIAHLQQVDFLGQGSFGVVVRAQQLPSGGNVAVKLMPRGQRIAEFGTYVRREILHQSNLRHPFIVELKEVFLTPTHLGIAMEYVPGGNLYQRLREVRTIPEHEARWFFQQLIIAVDYTHRLGVANRDLKLENILLDCNQQRPLLKLCDFGYSKHDSNSTADSIVGTNAYMAPEILRALPYNARRVDMWLCGVILYTMLFGRYPFPDDNPLEQRRMMLERGYPMPSLVSPSDKITDVVRREWLPSVTTTKPRVSLDGLDVIHKLLEPDPARRMTMDEVLHHPWFQRNLPPGSLRMNDDVLRRNSGRIAESNEELVNAVDRLVDRATHEGRPGEAKTRISLI